MRLALRGCQVAAVAVLLSGIAMAEWESIGNLQPAGRNANEFIFHHAHATVVLQVLAPDLIRVRCVHASSLPPDHSYAVVKTDWPNVKVDFSNDRKYQSIRTGQLEARIQLSPFRIAFYDPEGELLSKDSDTQGIAWNGDRVRVWKWEPADEHYFGFGEKSTPLDKRGRSLVMWNRDPEGFDASSEPLYESVPFFIALRRGRAYGIFLDNTWRSSFDMGSEIPDVYSFGAEGGELNYYFFAGPDRPHSLAATVGAGLHPEPLQLLSGEHGSFYRGELPPSADSVRWHFPRHRLHGWLSRFHLG
jgi:alpha-glucosidase